MINSACNPLNGQKVTHKYVQKMYLHERVIVGLLVKIGPLGVVNLQLH